MWSSVVRVEEAEALLYFRATWVFRKETLTSSRHRPSFRWRKTGEDQVPETDFSLQPRDLAYPRYICFIFHRVRGKIMVCNKDCYRKDAAADKVMSCALSHEPANMQVACDAAQRPGGILGTNSDGCNLLHIAAYRNNTNAVKLALARGMDPMYALATDIGSHPLKFAVFGNSLHSAQALLNVPAIGDHRNADLFADCLSTALQKGHEKMVDLFLRNLGALAFGYPGDPQTAFLYNATVDFTALSSANTVSTLKVLKSLGRSQGTNGDTFPRPGVSAGDPIVRAELCELFGREQLETPSPHNMHFMKEWIAEYEEFCKKRRRIQAIRRQDSAGKRRRRF